MMGVGIIAEYNPFHNGHMYHLQKIKEMFPDSVLVLVMSGNFTERGDVSIIDKWKKTKIAKEAGVDLIVELPFAFATQSADFFAYGAISILEKLKVSKVVFGSESDNIDDLEVIAKTQLSNPDFDKLVKIYSKFGENYPTSLSLAINDLTGKKIDAPNDLLGVSYIKTILRNSYNIEAIPIKRTNDYHGINIDKISSATAIREALKSGENVNEAVPQFVMDNLSDLHFIDDYFSLLKYKIITDCNLARYQTVDEGIEGKLKKEIVNAKSYDDLINRVKSKRYTYNKIKRMLLHILIGFTKDEAKGMKEVEYIRILGFSSRGQSYLNSIKKDVDIEILSKFKRNMSSQLELELRSSSIYALAHNEEYLVSEEYKNHLRKEL